MSGEIDSSAYKGQLLDLGSGTDRNKRTVYGKAMVSILFKRYGLVN